MATTKGLYTTNRTYVASLRGTYPYIQTYITDPFFSYTSLLLSGDTPSIPFNADASPNKFNITVFGDTKAANFSPYTSLSTPYLGSSYLDGTGDYLSIPANSAFTFGTNDHTIEFYYYLPSTSLAGGYATQWKYSSGSTQQATNDYYFQIGTAGGSNVGLLLGGGGSWGVLIQPSVSINAFVGVWTHIAWTRSGNTFRLFFNGAQVGTGTYSGSISAQSGPMLVGQGGASEWAGGYYADFRITNGTALYTGTFTSPTAPLTSVSNTQLLTLQNSQPHNNSTFLDSSSNKFLITRNGNTTQGTFTPYGSNWSNYFDGTGDYLEIASSTAFAFGTGNFTVEAWIYPLAYGGTVAGASIFGTVAGSASGYSLNLGESQDRMRIISNASGTWADNLVVSAGGGAPLNTWSHIAWVRNGNSMTIYKNGTSVATMSGVSAYNFTSPVNAGFIGFFWDGGSTRTFNGYISNSRVIKGTALYTSSFTPSTTPLTAVANTQLLTCQSNRFIDNSANNFTIIKYQDTSIQRFSPFSPSDIYSANTIGGSAYFDGSGDYLEAASNAEFALPGDFTYECWFNSDNTGTTSQFMEVPVSNGLQLYYSGSQIFVSAYGVSALITYTYTMPVGAWTHMAVVRSGTASNNLVLYINGVSVATASYNSSFPQGAFRIGGTSYYFKGYISNCRLVKGTAVYTSNFTPPTAPVTAVANTQLLCNFTDAAVTDYSMMVNLESLGDAKITTANSRVGGSAIYFDGNGDYLTAPSTAIFAFGTGAYTIEAWVYVTSRSTEGSIWATGSQNNNLLITTGGLLRLYNGTSYTGTTVIALNTWAHVAVVRTSTATNGTQLFVNGVSDLVFTDTTNQTSATTGIIGVNNTGSNQYFPGYIDDLRVTKGYARYTGNFTPINSSHPLR